MDFNEIVNKAKDFAQKNPEKLHDGLEKLEGAINKQTGNKYADQVDKLSDYAEKGLGVPAQKVAEAAKDSSN